MPSSARNTAPFVAHQIRGHGQELRTFIRERQASRAAAKGILRKFFREIAIASAPRQIAHDGLVILAAQSDDVVHRLGSWGLHEWNVGAAKTCTRPRSIALGWQPQ